MKALEPIWAAKPETATRVRARIEAVLDWATVSGYRAGDNPARWRGHLAKLLPALNKISRVKHHAALHFDQVGKFLVDLRKEEGTAARALELAVLTAARTGEIIGATPAEFDPDRALWTIPASRMKGGSIAYRYPPRGSDRAHPTGGGRRVLVPRNEAGEAN